jgi:hypothetical protein
MAIADKSPDATTIDPDTVVIATSMLATAAKKALSH